MLAALRDQARERAAEDGSQLLNNDYGRRYNALTKLLAGQDNVEIPELKSDGQGIWLRDFVDAVEFSLTILGGVDQVMTTGESLDQVVVGSTVHTEVGARKSPTAFIGCSTEGLPYARILQLELEHVADTTIWSQGVFGLSKGILETLVDKRSEFDYAILVLTPDDMELKRDELKQAPRDNVLFELGLFMGALGRERVFIVAQTGVALPSDFAGISTASFDPTTPANPVPALGPAATKLMIAMKVL